MWELDYKESWVPKKWFLWTVVLKKTLESPLDCKEIQPVYPQGNQSWIFNGRTDAEAETPIFLATWCEELTHLKRPWCWERLKSGGEGGDRRWDGWMASPIQWTWVWVSSASWWWTRRLGMLQSMGLQRVPQDWMTELTDLVSALFYWLPEEMTVTFSNLHLNSQRLQFLPFNIGGVCIFLLIFNIFAIEIFPHSSSLLTNFNILKMYTCVET